MIQTAHPKPTVMPAGILGEDALQLIGHELIRLTTSESPRYDPGQGRIMPAYSAYWVERAGGAQIDVTDYIEDSDYGEAPLGGQVTLSDDEAGEISVAFRAADIEWTDGDRCIVTYEVIAWGDC